MMFESDLIVRALRYPDSLAEISPHEWDLLVRQGRRANVLGRLACDLQLQGGFNHLFVPARRHLDSAATVARQQADAVRWETHCIRRAVTSSTPIILLKGAAYVMAGLPAAKGRLFTDVDILVPKDKIDDTENELIAAGWSSGHHDPYDQRYYRRWMHELPPLVHLRRGTVVDLHHAILPETARIKVDTAALWESPIPVPGYENVFVLNPVDMVLHSATHLFHEGELHNGLRDLFDLDTLFRHFGKNPDFWSALVPRARAIGLERPLFYALRYVRLVFDTPVPQHVVQETVGPADAILKLMDFCYLRALRPAHASCSDRWTWLARFALYVRSHWIRMPWHLLAYHLGHKALIPKHDTTDDDAAAARN